MATTPLAATTPPPPLHIHTPPTPRLGFADSWEPFSPRKSSRIAAASSSAARTPSPSAATRRAARPLRSPRLAKLQQNQQQHQSHHQQRQQRDLAALSPAPTPTKKRTMPTAHFLGPEDALKANKKATTTAAALEGSSSTTQMGLGMLPTPAKTPSKKHHAASQNESNIAAIARNLFHTNVEEVMSSPSRKKAKKYTGVSLESFTVVEDEEPIPIFTDSQDRVPEMDGSAENPFFGDGAVVPTAPEPTRRRSKRSHVSIPGEGKLSVEEATRREDGIVYVFRGKKIFRKFEDYVAEGADGATPGMRLTRSSIKPRLLFPRDENTPESLRRTGTSTAANGTTDDEEAVTDIEDDNLDGAETDIEDGDDAEEAAEPLDTPADLVDKAAPSTPPAAPRFAPASPPMTGRTTRSGQKVAEDATPVKAGGRTKKRSPFDGWRQTKSSAASAAGHKRPLDAMGSAAPSAGAKRTRS